MVSFGITQNKLNNMENIKKYKTMIIVILGAIATIIGVVTNSVEEIEKEVVTIDSVIKVTLDTTFNDSIK